jgi:uncharacterized protein YbaR (Trm112 family)
MSGRVDAELLDILVCPKCYGALALRSEAGAHVALECASCALGYPIEEGIPVMLIDEALPLSERKAGAAS